MRAAAGNISVSVHNHFSVDNLNNKKHILTDCHSNQKINGNLEHMWSNCSPKIVVFLKMRDHASKTYQINIFFIVNQTYSINHITNHFSVNHLKYQTHFLFHYALTYCRPIQKTGISKLVWPSIEDFCSPEIVVFLKGCGHTFKTYQINFYCGSYNKCTHFSFLWVTQIVDEWFFINFQLEKKIHKDLGISIHKENTTRFRCFWSPVEKIGCCGVVALSVLDMNFAIR